MMNRAAAGWWMSSEVQSARTVSVNHCVWFRPNMHSFGVSSFGYLVHSPTFP